MNVLIVGASSFIGLRIYHHLKNDRKFKLTGTYYEHQKDARFVHLDITNTSQLEKIILDSQPDALIWVAGSKNLKKCEQDVEYAKRINAYPVEQLVQILMQNKLSPHILFVSTDYVFDGKTGNYTDSDLPNPQTHYGQSNRIAEHTLQQSSFDHTIIRTSAVMGRYGTFFDWITDAMTHDQSIELYADSYFSPTSMGLLLQCVAVIINDNVRGVLHVCGNQRLSRYDFAKMLKQADVRFIAELIPVNAQSENVLFQHDLSMIPSDICSKFGMTTLLDELQDEM